jgi:nucleotide-binding universal stress UspA family protein
MPQVKRVLCPIDFSDASRHALDHAVMMAGWFRSTLTVMHVRHPVFLVEPPILFADLADSSLGTLEEVEARLQTWLEPVRAAGIACDALAVDGNNPASRIVEAVAQLDADLVVMGTHGRRGFERLMLGSATERVVRTATCPVVTVPPPTVTTSALPFRRVMCAVDFSDSSLNAVRFARSLAQESNSALTLLHVLEWPPESEALAMFDMTEYRDAVRRDAEERLAKLAQDPEFEGRRPAIRLVNGKPHEQILAVAVEDQTDIIVLGVHGRNPIDLMLFGSTTNQVIRRARCPVLTLRQ